MNLLVVGPQLASGVCAKCSEGRPLPRVKQESQRKFVKKLS